MRKSLVGFAVLVIAILVLLWSRRAPEMGKRISPAAPGGTASTEPARHEQLAGTDQTGVQETPRGQPQGKFKVSFSTSLSSILKKYVKASSEQAKGHPSRVPRFSMLSILGLAELRLLALSHPEESLKASDELISNPLRAEAERYCGLYLVWALTDGGNPPAREKLQGFANSPDPYISDMATNLATMLENTSGFHRNFQEKALQGKSECIEALGESSDPASTTVLKQVVSQGGPTGMMAEESLVQQDLVSSGRLNEALEPILAGNGGERAHWFPWALRMARKRSMPGLETILRARLERVVKQYQADLVTREELDLKGAGIDTFFQTEYSTSFRISMSDYYFDDILIALAATGAKMSELERKRLRFLGYDGNPEDRLGEILSGHR